MILFSGVLLVVALVLGAGLVLEGAQPHLGVVAEDTVALVRALGLAHVLVLVEGAIRVATAEMRHFRVLSADQ